MQQKKTDAGNEPPQRQFEDNPHKPPAESETAMERMESGKNRKNNKSRKI